MDPVITVGVDVGQRVDPTAVVVAEVTETDPISHDIDWHRLWVHDGCPPSCHGQPLYLVRFLERIALGTSYPHIAGRLVEMVDKLIEAHPRTNLNVVLDSTGVGAPVVDIIRDALRGTRVPVTAAIFTSSERLEGTLGNAEIRVGKPWLVSRLQALLQQSQVKLPDTPEAHACADELRDFELRVTPQANVVAGAFRTGTHDDLVTALGLAVLDDPRRHRVGLGPSLDG